MTECNSSAKVNKTDVIDAVNYLAQGKRSLICGEIFLAVNQIQNACRILAKEYGEMSNECAEAYFIYGKALLELHRNEASCLNEEQEEDEESGDSSEEEESQEANSNNENVTTGNVENISLMDGDSKSVDLNDADQEYNSDVDYIDDSKNDINVNNSINNNNNNTLTTKDKISIISINAEPEVNILNKTNKDQLNSCPSLNNTLDETKNKMNKSLEDNSMYYKSIGNNTNSLSSVSIEKERNNVDAGGDSVTEKSSLNKGNAASKVDVKYAGVTKDEECADEPPDSISNLQLAWEMFELAKIVFKRETDAEYQLKLADTHYKLGEVSLETGKYEESIADFTICLELQLMNLSEDSRLIADTHYQLGVSHNLNKAYPEAVQCFKKAIDVLKRRSLRLTQILANEMAPDPADDQSDGFYSPMEKAAQELDELKELVSDIELKIEEVRDEEKNADQVCKLLRESLSKIGPPIKLAIESSNAFSIQSIASTSLKASSCVAANDISHLVRKKRKNEDALETSQSKIPNNVEASTNKIQDSQGSI